MPACASTRPARPTTSATAASSSTSCASCSPHEPAARRRHRRPARRGARRGARSCCSSCSRRAAPPATRAPPAEVWRRAAGAFAEVRTDLVGTPLALVAAEGAARRRAARRLLVMGHIDEIGLIVTHIDDDGFLWFREVGGWDPQILVGQRVVLDTRGGPLPGVVGRKPIHLLRDEDRKKVAEIARAAHRHRRARRRAGARARARRRRRGDRRRARRAAATAGSPRARSTTASARSSRSRRRGSSREAGGGAVGARRGRGGAGGDDLRRLAHERLRAGARRRDRRRRDARHRRARHRGQGRRQPRARLGPRDQPRLDAQRAPVRAAVTTPPRRRGSRSRSRPPRARPAPTPTPCTSAAAASPRRSCRSRCATCTRPSSSCSSTTSHACARLIAAAPRARG